MSPFFFVFQYSQVMSYSSHVAHEYKNSVFFSFSLRDLPVVYIMHVMQFWPGIRTKKKRNDEMLRFRKLLLCVLVSSFSSSAK